MTRQTNDSAELIVIGLIALFAFPAIIVGILQSILLGIMLGLIGSIVVIAIIAIIYFWLENNNSYGF
jgi:hypothetical protein